MIWILGLGTWRAGAASAFGEGEQRGAEVPNQALGWERDNCCRVSSGSGSGGMPAMVVQSEGAVCEQLFSCLCFTTSSPFSTPSFPVEKLEKTEHVSGVKQSKKRSQRKYSLVFVVKHLGTCTVFWETLCPKKTSLVDFYLYGASSPWV